MAKRFKKATIFKVPLADGHYTYAIRKLNYHFIFFDYFDQELDLDVMLESKELLRVLINRPSVNKSNWIRTEITLDNYNEEESYFVRSIGHIGVYEHYVYVNGSQQLRRFVKDLQKGEGWLYYGFDENNVFFEQWYPDRSLLNGSICYAFWDVCHVEDSLNGYLQKPGEQIDSIYYNEYQESKGLANDPPDWDQVRPELPYGYVPRKKGDPYFDLCFPPDEEEFLEYTKRLGQQYYLDALELTRKREEGLLM